MSKDSEKDLETSEEEIENTDDNDIIEEEKPTHDQTDWEKSYKGLQKAAAKKQEDLENQVSDLNARIEELVEKSESGETDKQVLIKQLDKAKTDLEELKTNLSDATEEKNRLDNTLKRREVIGKKFPTLAPLQEYIPEGKDLEEYEQNAEQFASAMEVYTKNFLSADFEGASPQPKEDTEKVDTSKEDQLWSIIRTTAGVAGQEDKYQKAYADWMAIQEAKDN